MLLNIIYWGTILGAVFLCIMFMIYNAKNEKELVYHKPVEEINIDREDYDIKYSELYNGFRIEEEEKNLVIEIRTNIDLVNKLEYLRALKHKEEGTYRLYNQRKIK